MSGELEMVAAEIANKLCDLKFRDTTPSYPPGPKSSGYEYAEVPAWLLRQWLDAIQRQLGAKP